LEGFLVGFSDQYRVSAALEPFYDLGHLFGRLTLAKDNFGPTSAQSTVVVQLGKAKILVWQVAQLLHGCIHSHAVLFEREQKFPQATLFDGFAPLSVIDPN
jgi:hypothetical protein